MDDEVGASNFRQELAWARSDMSQVLLLKTPPTAAILPCDPHHMKGLTLAPKPGWSRFIGKSTSRVLWSTFTALISVSPVSAQLSLLPEFRVDATTNGKGAAACAANSFGSVLVTWVDNPYYGDHVMARMLDSDGSPQTAEFQVGTQTSSFSPPAVSSAGGSFGLAWREAFGVALGRGVEVDGTFATDAIPLSAYNVVSPSMPKMTVAGSEYWVQWTGGIDQFGSPGAGARTLSTQDFSPTGAQLDLAAFESTPCGNAVAAIPAGVLSAWVATEGGMLQVISQRFAPSGDAIGPPVVLSDDVWGGLDSPELASSSAGLLLVWLNETWDPVLGRAATRVQARPLDLSGGIAGPTVVLDADANHVPPTVVPDGTGGFIVSWVRGDAYLRDVILQNVDRFAHPIGAEVAAQDSPHANPNYPGLCLISSGRAMLVWTTETGYLDESISGRIVLVRESILAIPTLSPLSIILFSMVLAGLSLGLIHRRFRPE
ncbi:MAG: hypothetical protein AB7G12_13840 [Thermoanaerobaculia bacterium]